MNRYCYCAEQLPVSPEEWDAVADALAVDIMNTAQEAPESERAGMYAAAKLIRATQWFDRDGTPIHHCWKDRT